MVQSLQPKFNLVTMNSVMNTFNNTVQWCDAGRSFRGNEKCLAMANPVIHTVFKTKAMRRRQ